jgi:DNA-binding SARP family transcriptional activator/tetratricopeptide (TPR) repeat protein
VRDFLQDRLTRSIGADGVRAIHLRVAEAAETVDWRLAARHYLAANHEDDARRVLTAAIETILATGAYAAADEISSSFSSGGLTGTAGLILQSRLALQRAAVEEALRLAEEAWAADRTSTVVLLNLVAARSLAGDVEGALVAGRFLENSGPGELASIGRAFQRSIETSTFGSLEVAATELEKVAANERARGQDHFLGVALLNLSFVRLAMDQADISLACAVEAVSLLAASSAGVELVAARLSHATVLAYLGEIDEARAAIAVALQSAPAGQAVEIGSEIGSMEALFGESQAGWVAIDRISAALDAHRVDDEHAVWARAHLRLRDGDLAEAQLDVSALRFGRPSTVIAFEARRHLLAGLVHSQAGSAAATESIRQGIAIATSQGARLWVQYGSTLAALAEPGRDPSGVVSRIAIENPVILSMLAEAVLDRLKDLDAVATHSVVQAAERRPWRWRHATRRMLGSADVLKRQAAASLLEIIGEPEDVRRLREVSRSMRGRGVNRIGMSLARRVASRVVVDDLGRVRITIGRRVVEGADTRRKVMALLCLLLTKSRYSASREEVVDSLWPDLDPSSALNSLNQTVYFLRRVFEPDYLEDASPGYVGQDGETIWLDPELIESRSRRCLNIVRATPRDPDPDAALALARDYVGRFALDFAYDDWSAAYRDSLHAAYLRVIGRSIQLDLATGHFDRGIFLAERAAEVDPEADEIQASLVRLYRMSGAHAAAAEQYGHYTQTMRALGEEPVAFVDL